MNDTLEKMAAMIVERHRPDGLRETRMRIAIADVRYRANHRRVVFASQSFLSR